MDLKKKKKNRFEHQGLVISGWTLNKKSEMSEYNRVVKEWDHRRSNRNDVHNKMDGFQLWTESLHFTEVHANDLQQF